VPFGTGNDGLRFAVTVCTAFAGRRGRASWRSGRRSWNQEPTFGRPHMRTEMLMGLPSQAGEVSQDSSEVRPFPTRRNCELESRLRWEGKRRSRKTQLRETRLSRLRRAPTTADRHARSARPVRVAATTVAKTASVKTTQSLTSKRVGSHGHSIRISVSRVFYGVKGFSWTVKKL